MTCEDVLFGKLLAIVYKTRSKTVPAQRGVDASGCADTLQFNKKPSIILIGAHGTSGYLNITLGPQSRYFEACRNLHPDHAHSVVRQALAIAALRAYATMDNEIRNYLVGKALETEKSFDWDETSAGAVASRFQLCDRKYPIDVGARVLQLGAIEHKSLKTLGVDVVYEDSDSTIEQSNELVYLLGEQMERLFDPLAEYTPEFAENTYMAPSVTLSDVPLSRHQRTAEDDPELVRSICQELYLVQSHFHVDLMDFIHDFLIPLRITVLEESHASNSDDACPSTINSIFPPTIDEIARANSLLHDALEQALPFGSLEMLKACGMTIPYFYKACLRHEAATKNITASLAVRGKMIYSRVSNSAATKYTIRRIESILACGGHLLRIRLVLERLVSACTHQKLWKDQELLMANEYYDSACGTIDAFARQQSAGSYERHVFTRSGRLLVEMASDWPKELEFGWLSRRVVGIFDAQVMLQNTDDSVVLSSSAETSRSRTHIRPSHEHISGLAASALKTHIIIIFTDYIVIIETEKPISLTSASGIHIPSVADMLMHSMINEVPLKNIPAMRVVAWVEIGNVYAAEYSGDPTYEPVQETPQQGSLYLAIFTPSMFKFPRFKKTRNPSISQNLALYKLVRKDTFASKVVELITKAKVVAKAQPFHLFRTATPKMLLFSTVHEVKAYSDESQRFPVCLFLNLKATKTTLDVYGLLAAINVSFVDPATVSQVRIQIISKLGYSEERVVDRTLFSSTVTSLTAYLHTLILSSSNKKYLVPLMNSASIVAGLLVDYANDDYDESSDEDNEPSGLVAKVEPVTQEESKIVSPCNAQLIREENTKRRPSPSQYLKRIVHQKSLRRFLKLKERNKQDEPPKLTEDSTLNKNDHNTQPAAVENSPPLERDRALITDTPVAELAVADISPTTSPNSHHHDESPVYATNNQHSSDLVVTRIRPQPSSFAEHKTVPSSINEDEFSAWEDVTDTTASFSSMALSEAERQQQKQVDAWYHGDLRTREDDVLDDTSSEWSTSTSNTYQQQQLARLSQEREDELGGRQPLVEMEPSNIPDSRIMPRSANEKLENSISQKSIPSERSLVEILRQKTLSMSMDRETAEKYNKHARKNSFAPIQTGNISQSQSFTKDFGYLAGAVSVDVNGQSDFEGSHTRDNSKRLYPDLRDSSIVFLREIIIEKDSESVKEESRDDVASLAISPSNSQPSSLAISRRKRESFTPTFKFPPPPLPISTSFRQLISESSVNTLQLASFTVQIERLMDDVDPLAKAELALIRDWIIILYEETRSLISEDLQKEDLLSFEKSCKKRACACLWIVIWLQSRNKAYSTHYASLLLEILDLEWIRRTKLWQAVGPDAYKLW